MCNECGNCGVFCPYDSTPYRDKLTLIAGAVALWAFRHLNGVGIDTIFSALAVGQLVKVWSRLYNKRHC